MSVIDTLFKSEGKWSVKKVIGVALAVFTFIEVGLHIDIPFFDPKVANQAAKVAGVPTPAER